MPTVIPPTPLERGLRASVYAGVGFSGLWTLLNPPTTLGDALGYWLTVIWALFMLTAAGALVAALAGRYRVEFLLLPYPTMALAIADLHIWVLAADPAAPADVFSRAAVIGALVAALATRYAGLARLVRQRPRTPRRGPGHRRG